MKKTVKKIRLTKDEQQLINSAAQAMKNAYAPYSRFKVGAALRAQTGEIFLGCNVENISNGATICAERTAMVSAVAAGQQSFDLLAVMTKSSPPSPPCALCLQVLVEFCPELVILLANTKGEVERVRLSKLLPRPFSPKTHPSLLKK
jgi:cytidine deaminase